MITEKGKLKIEREFSIQCTNEREDGTLWFDKYKFVELIVRECISKAEDYGLGCDAVEQMKQHFGVKDD